MNPLMNVCRWLFSYAGYPATKVEVHALTLLCIASIARAEELSEERGRIPMSRDPAQTSALRAHALRRAQVHYKCDNSAKV